MSEYTKSLQRIHNMETFLLDMKRKKKRIIVHEINVLLKIDILGVTSGNQFLVSLLKI